MREWEEPSFDDFKEEPSVWRLKSLRGNVARTALILFIHGGPRQWLVMRRMNAEHDHADDHEDSERQNNAFEKRHSTTGGNRKENVLHRRKAARPSRASVSRDSCDFPKPANVGQNLTS
jgi:hypothetical protein